MQCRGAIIPTVDSSIFRFLKKCSWVNRLYGIGGRLRRLQRPSPVFRKAIMVHTKYNVFVCLGRISDSRKVVKTWKCDKHGQPWLLLKKRDLGMVDASSIYKSAISLYAGLIQQNENTPGGVPPPQLAKSAALYGGAGGVLGYSGPVYFYMGPPKGRGPMQPLGDV